MIGYVLWLLAGVVLGVWLTYLQAGKAWVDRRLQELDARQGEVPSVRDNDPADR